MRKIQFHFVLTSFVRFVLGMYFSTNCLALSQQQKTDSFSADTIQDEKSKIDILQKTALKTMKSAPEESIEYYNQLIKLGKKQKNQQVISSAYNALGTIWNDKDNLQESTKNYFLALENLDEQEENFELLCSIHKHIGTNFQKQKDFRRALEYYGKGEVYCNESDDLSTVAQILNNMGTVYKELEDYNTALQSLNKALAINQNIGAIKDELLNINNIGVIHMEKGDYYTANKFFTKALSINQKRNDQSESTNNLTNLGRSLFKLGKLKSSEDTLKKALQLSEITGSLNQKHEILHYLFRVKREQKDYEEALTFYIQYNDIGDRLFKKDQYTKLIELESKYKVAQQDRFIHESQNQLLRQQYLNTLFLAALIFSVLLIGFLTWVYTSKKNNEQKLITLNKEIDTKNEKIQSINQNLEKTIQKRTKVIKDQNDQLREFAFMNSHNLRRPLANILALLSLLEDEDDREKINEFISLATETANEMDGIIQDVNSLLKEGDL